MVPTEPMGANAFRYFLRIEGTAQGIEKDLSAFFLSEGETLSPVVLDGRTDEFALVSTLLFEEDFLERLQAFEEASGRRVFHFIRVKKMLED